MSVTAWIHLALAGVWLGLIYPTVTRWRDSIRWVALMSAYAIVISHLSAFQAASLQ